MRNLGVFGGDQLRAAADAFIANLAAVARDNAKDIFGALAAEGAISVSHG